MASRDAQGAPPTAAPRSGMTPVVIIAVVTAALLPLVLLLSQGHRHLSAGEFHLKRGEIHEAIFQFGRAARAYVPMGPFHGEAQSKLMGLGLAVEERGDDVLALQAYDTLRRSILAGRWLLGPEASALAPVNEAMAALYARLPKTPWPDPTLSQEAREAVALARLSQVEEPSRGLAFLGGLSCLGWIVGALGVIRRGFERDGTLRPRPALSYGAGTLLCLALFFLSMGLA